MRHDGFILRQDTVGGLDIFSRVSTDNFSAGRPPIVLVHGLSQSSSYLMPTAARLAEKYCIYVPDLPGFGRSKKTKKIFTIEEMAEVLEAWIEALGLGEIVLLGNSLGSEFIIEHTLQYPGRAREIILTGLTPDPKRRSFFQYMLRLFAAGMLEPPSFLPVTIKDYLAAGVRRTLQTARCTLDDPIKQKLPRVNIPALVVRGSMDPIVSQEWAEESARLLPSGRLEVIQGGGHAVNWSYAEELCRKVEGFVGKGIREREHAQDAR